MELPNRFLTWVLVVVLVAAIGGVIYLSLNPSPASRPYTEFYVLGPDGNASDYPTNLSVGEEATVTVGVTNHERATISYEVVVAWNETTVHERTLRVADEATEEFNVSVTAPDEPGVYQLRFFLFWSGGDGQQMSDPLYLRVTVTGSP